MESIYENIKGSDTLVVAFQAHENTVFGTTVDEFKGVLSQLNYDTLRINDTTGNFFFNGIDGTYDSMEKVLSKLSEYISGYTKTIFIGNCGGGHASILYGTMLNVDKVIGFNPTTYLDQTTLLLNEDGREDRLNFLNQSIEYLNLKPYLDNKVYDTKIYSIVAQNTDTDRHVKQSNNISTCPNVNIEFINCEIPHVAYYLMRRNELISKIVEIVEI
jgi:hypothetical protein